MSAKTFLLNTASVLRADNFLFFSRKYFNKNSTTVLSVHRVSDEEDFFWQPLKIETFKQLIAYCVKNYQVVTFEQADKILHPRKPLLVLSFDDGYKDFIENALPVLISYNIPCNHNFVVNCAEYNEMIWTQKLNFIFNYLRNSHYEGHLPFTNQPLRFYGNKTEWMRIYLIALRELFVTQAEKRNSIISSWANELSIDIKPASMMNWEDINYSVKNGVEPGSHTVSHESLVSISSPVEIEREVMGSKKIIEEKTGKNIKIFAVPNGQFNDRVISCAKRAGYEKILIVEGLPQFNSSIKIIPRINLIEEPIKLMRLRITGFHSLFKKY